MLFAIWTTGKSAYVDVNKLKVHLSEKLWCPISMRASQIAGSVLSLIAVPLEAEFDWCWSGAEAGRLHGEGDKQVSFIPDCRPCFSFISCITLLTGANVAIWSQPSCGLSNYCSCDFLFNAALLTFFFLIFKFFLVAVVPDTQQTGDNTCCLSASGPQYGNSDVMHIVYLFCSASNRWYKRF